MNTYAILFICFGLQGNVNIPADEPNEIYNAFNSFFNNCDEGFYSKNGQPDADMVKELIGDLLAEDFGVDVSEVEWCVPQFNIFDNTLMTVDKVS